MGKRNGETTIADVASTAGVSPATVSRVMNDRFVGDPAVALHVRTVARELNYRPSPLARSLALGMTKTIAFVVPDLANPTFHAVLSALSKAAARDGYRVLIADSVEHSEDEEQIALDIRRRCDSIVLCAPRMPEERLALLEDELAPMVLINRSGPQLTAPSVSVDYASGIVALAQHAYDRGHRHLVYLEGPTVSMSNTRRLEGLEGFLAEHPDATLSRIAGGVSAADGEAASAAVATSGASVALAFNDLVAIGLMQGLAAAGVRVPDDISVIGFDDIPFARYMNLTTATAPHDRLGTEAWARLQALSLKADPGENVLLEPELRIRSSLRSVSQA